MGESVQQGRRHPLALEDLLLFERLIGLAGFTGQLFKLRMEADADAHDSPIRANSCRRAPVNDFVGLSP